MVNQRIIGLITDFGNKGQHYVASMKGVIFQINPESKIVDLSHEITPFSIIEASYVIKATHKYLPENAIFIIVVDPGVGSSREILAIKTTFHQHFIGPNNGIFSLFLREEEILDCVELNNDNYYFKSISNTFHGRDIMAPIGAYLSINTPINKLGTNFDPAKIIKVEIPLRSEENRIECIIQYIDNFGNAITNIPIIEDSFEGLAFVEGKKLVLKYRNKRYEGIFSSYFNAVPEKSLLFIKGSTNFLEISINQGSAANWIGFKVGDIITITY